MIIYSGGPLINITFAPVTRGDWVSSVTAALAQAGWTPISGVPGSGSDVILETFPGVQNQRIRFRFLDPGSGNCAVVYLRNQAGTIISLPVYCLPGTATWRIIANKYHFFCFMSGAANALAARGFVAGGTLYTPPFQLVQMDCGWMTGNGISDTDAQTRDSFRTNTRGDLNTAIGIGVGLWNGNLVQASATTGNAGGFPGLLSWYGGTVTGDTGYRWDDLLTTYQAFEPMMQWWAGASSGTQGRIKGQLYDAIVITGVPGATVSETTIQLDSKVWMAVTNGPLVTRGSGQLLYLCVGAVADIKILQRTATDAPVTAEAVVQTH